MSLHRGKVAIIVGASASLSMGRAIATKLGRGGAKLVINGRDPDSLSTAVDALTSEGFRVIGVPGSATDEKVLAQIADAAQGEFGGIDYVVNTVGGSPYRGSLWDMSRDDLLYSVEINAWPIVAMVREARRAGLGQGRGGAVVNMSSATVGMSTMQMGAYKSGKSVVNALTETMAHTLGGEGIRVNAVAPALVATNATRAFWEADDGAEAGRNHVLGRLTRPSDVADAVGFLLSGEAQAITGIVLSVDGGNHLQGGGWSPRAG